MTAQTDAPRFPGPGEGWRCGGCGNLTRFDVTRSVRATEYWHFDLAGDHRVEEREVSAEQLVSVSCRWCGRRDAVAVVDRNDADLADAPVVD